MMYKILSVCNGGGYRYCRTDPPHPRANSKGLYPLHRVMAENMLGRSLRSDEHVHHKDGDKTNDTEENLQVLTAAEHARLHIKPAETAEESCPVCGAAFTKPKRYFKFKRSYNKTGMAYCSRRCGGYGAIRHRQQSAAR